MDTWHEEEAKAECRDLRVRVREQDAEIEFLTRERDELREALTEIMVEMLWDQPGWDQMDLQDAMVARGIIVEAPAPPEYVDEWGHATWLTTRWNAKREGE